MALFAAAVAGGCAGFLAWNFTRPKRLWAIRAVCSWGRGGGRGLRHRPAGAAPFHGCYLPDRAFSVMLQVTYFKLTHGKRIFK